MGRVTFSSIQQKTASSAATNQHADKAVMGSSDRASASFDYHAFQNEAGDELSIQ